MGTDPFKWGPTPFRFENMWLQHSSFKENFGRWWSEFQGNGWEGHKFMRKLQFVKAKLKEWNKTSFGELSKKKKDILAVLANFDSLEQEGGLSHELLVQRALSKGELEELILREEIHWRQKARVKWVKEGDCNSKFFHKVANGRRNRKFIKELENESGLMLNNPESIKEEILRLESPFTEEEIYKAIFQMDRDKAPGPDGFTIAVFQDCWDVIKEDLVRVFAEFHRSGIINQSTNASFIVLLPKKSRSRRISDFRPISLITSLYKIIAKVLAERLRGALHETIHSTQGAFVQGRQILDAVLIANEIVDEKRRTGEEGVVFKIDFEKAYDHVSWDFLDHVLEMKGFSLRWRKWMRGCLSSVSYAVLVNGNAKGWVKASRGLRQGDPLSPFLFTIVADVLSRMLLKAEERNVLEGFRVGRNKTRVSHLQFADDTIFFSSTREEDMMTLKSVLLVFVHIFGLKVNLDKSNIYDINLEQNHLSRLAEMLDCKASGWPILYLGLPLGGNPKASGFWDPVIERISRRLDGWQKAYLSFGGKWLWRYPREGSALWHQVILSIYGSHSNGWDVNNNVRWSHRCPWKAIALVFQEFSKFTRFVVGDGDRIRFWDDLWWGDQPLGTQYPRLLSVVTDKNAPISSILGYSRPFSWNFNFRRNLTDSEIEDLESLMQSLIVYTYLLRFQIRDPGPYLLQVSSQSNLSFWPYPNIPSRLQCSLLSLSGILKSLSKSSPLSVEAKKGEALKQVEYWDEKEKYAALNMEECEARNGARDYKSWLYQEEEGWRPSVDGISFMRLDNSEAKGLENPFSEEEVFAALTDLGKDKAPGPDGFTMAFWLFGWDVVKVEIIGLFREFHERGRFVKSLNATFMVLVPKKGGVEDLNDFRPISLVGSIYKLLAKVWQIESRRLKSNQGGVMCKLDIEKTYDHVCWKFLVAVLKQMGFGRDGLRLKVNLEKSELIPVGRVNDIEDLALELGCKVGGLPSSYLGLALGAPFKSEVKIKVEVGEDSKGLSVGGGALEQRPHLVRWNSICLERKKGGLGVRNLALMNKALLGGGWCTRAESGRHGVGLWKAIRKEWLGMYSSLAFCVGNGKRVRFWKDKWCGDEPLYESFPSLFAISLAKDAWVLEVWNPDGVGDGWTPLFSRELNDWEIEMVEQFMLKIQAFKVQRENEDKVVWTTSRSGDFSIKSQYSTLEPGGSSLFPYVGIWRAYVPPKVAFFAWEASWDKILTLD
ncbi:Transposon TX1 uncharacterized 149 kDa protein [Vitis vinifera]|uniref:Transposon TX1 uncharacterized 149 kDa protein n=1 Tax=Vitis vinifera TaxID=29760 RepID=A0A438DVH3_VITVI|nr:Transposon TX1 uncharacterized 149 kDa protein [Vitis vinifera]